MYIKKLPSLDVNTESRECTRRCLSHIICLRRVPRAHPAPSLSHHLPAQSPTSALGAISFTSLACTERVRAPLRLLQAPFSFLPFPFAHPHSIYPWSSLPLGTTLQYSRAVQYNPDIPGRLGTPWHIQVQRDVSSYGDIGPPVDPRIIVDIRFYGRSDLISENRVEFSPRSSNENWVGGDTDIYGMPQPTV